MMRKIIGLNLARSTFYFWITLNFGIQSWSQNGEFRFGGGYNFGIWNPDTESVQNFESQGVERRINTVQFGADVTLANYKRFRYGLGITTRFVSYALIDLVKSTYYQTSIAEFEQYDFADPMDYRVKQWMIGFSHNFFLELSKKPKWSNDIGFSLYQFYYESYQAYFYTTDDASAFVNFHLRDLSQFMLTNVSGELFYRHRWHFSPKVNLAARASVGINMRSDWPSFKRSAWLSIGLELGLDFSKKD
jgi:hypothetical protein